MEVCNCIRCKKIFNHISGPKLCKSCDKIVFDIIKDYLTQNPNSNSLKISKETKIPNSVIGQYLLDKRLQIIRPEIKLCPLCGDLSSKESTYCEKCLTKIKLKKDIKLQKNKIVDNQEQITGPRMRYIKNSHERK